MNEPFTEISDDDYIDPEYNYQHKNKSNTKGFVIGAFIGAVLWVALCALTHYLSIYLRH